MRVFIVSSFNSIFSFREAERFVKALKIKINLIGWAGNVNSENGTTKSTLVSRCLINGKVIINW
jgi:hypothetical protein